MTLPARLQPVSDTHIALQRVEEFRIRTTLARVPIFQGLPHDVIDWLASRVLVRRVLGGSSAVRSGDPGDAFYVIMAGRAKEVVIRDTGREMTLSVLRAFDTFGETSLFGGNGHAATVTAITPMVLLVIARPDLEAHLASHPQTALRLLSEMTRQLRRANQAIAELAFNDVSERLQRRLLAMAREEGCETPDGLVLSRRPTQQELANMVGSCRETVSRTFNALVRKRLFVPCGRGLVVTHRAIALLEPGKPSKLGASVQRIST